MIFWSMLLRGFQAYDSPSLQKDCFRRMGRYVHDHNPDMIVQTGDLFSFDSLCRFEGNDTPTGKAKPVFTDDVASGHEALRQFDDGAGGWNGEKHGPRGARCRSDPGRPR